LAPDGTDAVSGEDHDAPLERELLARIDRYGGRPYDEVVELALYHPEHGFYSRGGAAGRRRGDFITSPEVGPLFGAVLARALDTWWRDLGRPDPFLVVECGAGTGTLARTVYAAEPECGPALTYVMVERSATLRARHADHLPLTDPVLALGPQMVAAADESESSPVGGQGPRFTSLANLPAGGVVGVVVANELLDNLPFRVAERRADGWREVRVGAGADRRLVERVEPSPDQLEETATTLAPEAPVGGRIPVQTAAADWLRAALGRVERGRVVVVDYASTTPELATRPMPEWLRTYREHARGGPPLERLGSQDITVDVCVDQLVRVRRPAADRSQSEFLHVHGLGELVEEGKQIWRERGHLGDLEAVRGRSRISEAEALSDREGLGAFRVLEWPVG
jgi:SAM-dependent MidA family methyltransferase